LNKTEKIREAIIATDPDYVVWSLRLNTRILRTLFLFETVNAFSVRVNPKIQVQYQYFNVGESKFQTRYYIMNSKKNAHSEGQMMGLLQNGN
tara:strand:- start:2016 stop:2291 length:276 start_codon:yes stop_codon:yes gene_type:complete